MPRKLVALLALAAGATVANLYYSQPLLAEIAREYGIRSAVVSMISTATQLGYAAGLLLLVPLGDAIERRRLLVGMTSLIVAALLVVGVVRPFPLLLAGSFILGAVSIVPQLVVPFAAHLASAEERNRVIGIVMSGLLVGVILSRSISGYLSSFIGWRTMYFVAAAAMLLLAVVLRFALPVEPPETRIRYARLLASLFSLARRERVLQRHSLVGAFGFASFSVFWTSLPFHLKSLSPSYGTGTVGAFGIIGVTGALVAPLAGRLADRVHPRVMNGIALAMMVLAYGLMFVSGASLVALAVGVILLDAGAQSSHISNQARIFAIDPSLRNRVNAFYMVMYFIGGAAGSLTAGAEWQRGGWSAVCVAGALFPLSGIVALFAIRDRAAD